ncbi:hypothetical protein CEP54_015650 [Fusarium duplospermum]|uniref:Uncharacterized protein n=1 Tax=Fusarium duplospermum TaxID=1325734 RepID=A0A428NMG7_9HYPO|nr:hypothetical protein CEP54_015650 [Fusarium duplospermum]
MDVYTSQERQKRISELIEERAKEQEELTKLEGFIERLPDADQMRRSGSSSRARRKGAPEALTQEQLLRQLKEDKAKKLENIANLWKKICDLQDQERATK